MDFRRGRKQITPAAAGFLAVCFSVLLILGLWLSPVSFSPLAAFAIGSPAETEKAPAPMQNVSVTSQIKPVYYKTRIAGAGILDSSPAQGAAAARDITLRLFADGKEVRQLHLKAAGRLWNFDFGEYETYYSGVPIRYTLRTDPVEDYVVRILPAQGDGTLNFNLTATPSHIVRQSRNLAASGSGDDSRMLLWGVLCAASLLLLVLFLQFRSGRFFN